MSTFAEMEALVIGQTRRPEVSAITQAAIRTATLRAHHTDFFNKDLATSLLSYTPSASAIYYDLPDISTTLPRLRAMQLLQSVDTTYYQPTEELEYREVQDLYDKDNTLRKSMYTLIGDTLRVYPQSVTGSMSAYFYQNPNVASDTYSSWIANNHADELAMWAAAIVFARTGFADMAADFQKNHITPFKELLLSSYLLATVN